MAEIDFVIPWVDGGDKKWKEEKQKFESKDEVGSSEERFRDWDNLRYLFRGIEEYAPWVNKVFFITWGHLPSFLNIEHPKLRIVNHREYIPDMYLPTFNSHTIELNLHRIKDLGENFVYFNDDTFLINPVERDDFFVEDLPCEEAVEEPIIARTEKGRIQINHIRMNNMAIINKHFQKREVLHKYWEKWINPIYGEALERTMSMLPWNNFAGFKNAHLPVAVKKSTIAKLWEMEYETLHNTSLHKFRSIEDVNQYLIRYWQMVSGEFIPQKALGKYYALTDYNIDEISMQIKNSTDKMICLNDIGEISNFEYSKQKIVEAFEYKLMKKSLYEV